MRRSSCFFWSALLEPRLNFRVLTPPPDRSHPHRDLNTPANPEEGLIPLGGVLGCWGTSQCAVDEAHTHIHTFQRVPKGSGSYGAHGCAEYLAASWRRGVHRSTAVVWQGAYMRPALIQACAPSPFPEPMKISIRAQLIG